MLRKYAKKLYQLLFVPNKWKLMETHSGVQSYWKNPRDNNKAEYYLDAPERTGFLVNLFKNRVDKSAHILEIGCGAGRNLYGLWCAGYKNLMGIEISARAIKIMRKAYPDMKVPILTEAVEDAISKLRNDEYDVTFTMALFQTLHPDSEWIFKEIARTSKQIISIEDEVSTKPGHFPRNYREIFGKFGMKQIHEANCSEIKGLGKDFTARVLVKE